MRRGVLQFNILIARPGWRLSRVAMTPTRLILLAHEKASADLQGREVRRGMKATCKAYRLFESCSTEKEDRLLRRASEVSHSRLSD